VPASANVLVACPLGKLSAPPMVRPTSGLRTNSVRALAAGVATAASTAPDHRRVATQARTSARVIRVTGISEPVSARTLSSAGNPFRADLTGVSTAVSSHPACRWPAKVIPSSTVTVTQKASSAAAGRRSGAGSRQAAPGRPAVGRWGVGRWGVGRWGVGRWGVGCWGVG